MTRVTLDPTRGNAHGTHVIAGVQFVDGVSDDVELRPNARKYFAMFGATFDEPQPGMGWSKPELIEHAESVGADLTDARTKSDILAAIDAAGSASPPPVEDGTA